MHHHCTKDDPSAGNFISPKDVASWNTMLQIRKYAAVLSIADTTPECEVSCIFYHRWCKSTFASKETVDPTLNILVEQFQLKQVEGPPGPLTQYPQALYTIPSIYFVKKKPTTIIG